MNQYRQLSGLKIKYTQNADGSFTPAADERTLAKTHRYPSPPNVALEVKLGPTICWMDKEQYIYGITGPGKILKSSDWWNEASRIEVLTIPDVATYGTQVCLVVSNTGRIVYWTDTGNVFISDEAQTVFPSTPAFKFVAGCPNIKHGYAQFGSVILLSAYGDKETMNPPREVYMSVDSGATFTKIFDKPIESMKDPLQYHIHDVEYDPFSSRIWIWVGDNDNTRLVYSDNLGGTWTEIDGVQGYNATQLLSFPHGLILGSDSSYSGLFYWQRSNKFIQPVVKSEDIEKDYLRFDNILSLWGYAAHRWMDYDKQIYLLPFVRAGSPGGFSRLLLSSDGIKWWEIYKATNTVDTGFFNVMGPDANGYLYGIYCVGTMPYNFRCKLPTFKTVL